MPGFAVESTMDRLGFLAEILKVASSAADTKRFYGNQHDSRLSFDIPSTCVVCWKDQSSSTLYLFVNFVHILDSHFQLFLDYLP